MLSAARDYDVVATVQDQVYKGKNGVDAAVLRAVDEAGALSLPIKTRRSTQHSPPRRRG